LQGIDNDGEPVCGTHWKRFRKWMGHTQSAFSLKGVLDISAKGPLGKSSINKKCFHDINFR
jgi:hypothetical protein